VKWSLVWEIGRFLGQCAIESMDKKNLLLREWTARRKFSDFTSWQTRERH
jgi:hypothetical protein